MTSFSNPQSSDLPSSLESFHDWKLEDAEVSLSEVVRLARDSEPQRITVRGEDAVVVLSAKAFAKVLPLMGQPSLQALLSQSPLRCLNFEQAGIQSPVRNIEL